MAHELTIRANASAEMAYVGDTPWHGLGQNLERGASIEQWTTAAGMDWKINRSRVRYGEGDNQKIDETHHVLFRSDTKAALGVVSPKFKIVQPGDVLGFFRDLVGANGFELETAGTLFGGKRFWALASIGERAVIGNADLVGGYLLLSTGADGSLATTGRFTTVRVVCNNTLSMALSEATKDVAKVSHKSEFNHAKIKAQLGLASDKFATFVRAMRYLSKTTLSPKVADSWTMKLLAPKAVPENFTHEALVVEQDRVRNTNAYQSILALFNGKGMGSNLAGAQDSAWGWVNAVTQHTDHVGTARTTDGRLNSAWFEAGDVLKTRAVEIALSA